MIKRIRIIIISILLAVLLPGSAYFVLFYEKPYLFKFMITPSMTDCTYYYILYNNRTLFCSVINPRSESKDIKSKLFPWEIHEYQEKKLTDEESEKLLNLIEKVEKGINYKPDKIVCGNDLHVTLSFKGKIYKTDYMAVSNYELVGFCNKIVELSSIEVKDFPLKSLMDTQESCS